MSIINDISDALQRGKKKEVTKLVQQAIDEGIDATTILKDGLLVVCTSSVRNSKMTKYSYRKY